MSLVYAFLSPVLPGSALLAATLNSNAISRHATSLKDHIPLLRRLAAALPRSPVGLGTVLKIALGFAVLRRLNHVLSIIGANSWRLSTPPGWDWPGEIAVVTGGCSGIGKEVATKLTAKGIRVAILDVQEAPESLQTNPLVRTYKCDVSDPEAVAAVAEAVREDLGPPSILVNNAAVIGFGTILDVPNDKVSHTFAVNNAGLWFTTKQFLPHMIASNKGHVVTVASLASYISLSLAAVYSASKTGAVAFHEVLTGELRHIYKAPNVLTTIVHPYLVRTPMVQNLAERFDQRQYAVLPSDDVSDRIVAQILSKRGGRLIAPESLAFLTSLRAWPLWMQEAFRGWTGNTLFKMLTQG
jgi:all-trans-retinol dehydrogenase (NAD+)